MNLTCEFMNLTNYANLSISLIGQFDESHQLYKIMNLADYANLSISLIVQNYESRRFYKLE